jgi:hypothetical protein
MKRMWFSRRLVGWRMTPSCVVYHHAMIHWLEAEAPTLAASRFERITEPAATITN